MYRHLTRQIGQEPKVPAEFFEAYRPGYNLFWGLFKGFLIISTVFVSLFFGTGFLLFSLKVLYNLGLSLTNSTTNLSDISLLFFIPFAVWGARMLFMSAWMAYLCFRNNTDPSEMRETINNGMLVSGQIRTVYPHAEKNKRTCIEYTFTSPNNRYLRGVFVASREKDVDPEDEIAVWYVTDTRHTIL